MFIKMCVVLKNKDTRSKEFFGNSKMMLLLLFWICAALVEGIPAWTPITNNPSQINYANRPLQKTIQQLWFTPSINEPVAQERQGSQIDSTPQNERCVGRTCNQIVTGRRLKYGRALAIIQLQQYLQAVDVDFIRRNKRFRRETLQKLLNNLKAKKKVIKNIKNKEKNNTATNSHRQKRQYGGEPVELIIQCRKRQSNGDSENPLGFFQKELEDYKTGFGEIESDFWIGLDLLHNMTSIPDSSWRLEVSVQDWDNKQYVAYYQSFYVGSEGSKYKLSLSGYDNVTSTLPDAFGQGGQSNAEFTTSDEDNDSFQSGNCATQYSGGWWHSGCGMVNLNGINSNSQLNTVDPTAYNGIVWYPFFASTEGRGTQLEPDGGTWRTFKATEMKIYANVDIEDDIDVVEIITTTAAAAAAAAAVAAAAGASGGSSGGLGSMSAGNVPSGLPQPGAVGGGSIFSSGSSLAGSAQALAAGLVPAGLTPVAFFAPTATQQLPAISVIFLELPLSGKKRKKRSSKHWYSDNYDNYNNMADYIFSYYKRNLRRFTKLVQKGDINRLLRPGKFSTEPPNNLELILRYKNSHFEGMINSTKNKIDALPKNLNTIAKELFRMGVCLKPRLIRSGIERIKSSINPQEIVSEVDILGDTTSERTPRFLKLGRLRKIIKRINSGKNLVWKTYIKQFMSNWKINYEFIYKAYFTKIGQILTSSTESRTMEDVMNMMDENTEGNMEFPRDVMIEDCFAGSEEPLYGFVTNVTIPEDMIKPCLVNIECFENGTSINATNNTQDNADDIPGVNSESRIDKPLKRQGLLHEATRRQIGEEFRRAGRPTCRARRIPLNRCRRNNNRRSDNVFPGVKTALRPIERQGETGTEIIPVFDQHMAYLSTLPASVWLLPLGVFTVGLKYKDAIGEYTDLVFGLISNIITSVLDTLSFVTSPILALASPIIDFVFGPSPPSMLDSELSIYPLFGPAAICFFSKTHAPFTVVLNEKANSGRSNYDGIFGWIADITSNVILPSASTAATNFMQCLERGPRIISSPLDFESKTTNAPVVRTTEPPIARALTDSCELEDTDLSDPTPISLSFSTSATAYAKCEQEQSNCAGITFEPDTKMWTLRSGSTTITSNKEGYISMLKECIEAEFESGAAPFIVTRQDVALAINSFSSPQLTFANVNGQKLDEAISVVVGSPVSVKCAGFGNGAPIWSWTFTNLYTEITDSSTPTTDSLTSSTSITLESYVTPTGNLLARANLTSPSYAQAGTYTCQAASNTKRSSSTFRQASASRSIDVTITCQKTSHCPTTPTGLFCLSNKECNICLQNSGTHEECNPYSSTPVCDMNSEDVGIQDSGVRVLAECVACNIDAGAMDDGTTRGKCPTNPSNLFCHSNGHCNVCRLDTSSGVNVGCETLSSTPVCDADSTTTIVDDSALEKRAACVGCKQDDGITPGDGFSASKCSQYNCLSNGYCNVCGLLSGYAEGCNIYSTTPVCDGDNATPGIQELTTGTVAHCVSCTKSDGTTSGDGTTIENCPSSYITYKCLSTGLCNICGLISGYAQGCDIHSITPVCDADSTATGIQDSATDKLAHCVACKMLDRTTPGDGTTIGICPSGYGNYRCLSTGACNVCGLIAGKHEGCDVTSINPICDADSTTNGVQDSADGKVAQCTSCKKDDGVTDGDGTTVGKCPDNLRCFSSGECGVCKIISSIHEGCSGSTPSCDESTTPPTCVACSKLATGGTPGSGDGTTQGDCPDDRFCYSSGECDLCSKDAPNGTPGDGTGNSQGNCPGVLRCFSFGCGCENSNDCLTSTVTANTCTSKVCMCGSSPACSGASNICTLGVCKCGSNPVCSGTTDTCDSDTCKCGGNDPCPTGFTCSAGICLCGGVECDSTANVCLNDMCQCGTGGACTTGSTTPACLTTIGAVDSTSIDMTATCQCSSLRLTDDVDTALGANNPHYGCDVLNPICKPPSLGIAAQCVCASTNSVKCTTSESTQCTASGTVASPVDGTCKCGSENTCSANSVTPACLIASDGKVPDVGATSGTSCQCSSLRLVNENDAALSATNPHYGCDGLKPICKPPSSGTDAQCVCATSNDATCIMPESTQCTASGSASSPTDGICMCGSANICAPASTTPSCLLTSDGQTPTVGAASGTSCQCSGAGTSDTCYVTTNTNYVAVMPACGTSTYGTLGACGKCQKNSDGSGGDGDGSTQGTCPSGNVCTETGECTEGCGSGPSCENGEICEDGNCKCGSIATCVGVTTGAYCDSGNSVCKCTASLDSCAGAAAGEYCDSTNNICTCTSSLSTCSSSKSVCSSEQCVCPSGYQEHGGKCYFFSSEQKSWDDARTACQNIHTAYDLVNIENTNLNTFLVTNIQSISWTGLSDVSIEGAYVWTNGEGLIYGSTLMSDPWHSSEPDASIEHDCVVLHSSNGLWYDDPCSTLRNFICGPKVGCADGSVEQIFQAGTMFGCDGNYNSNNFREACTEGWAVATAAQYLAYGGATVQPNAERWIDATWDSNGYETSLENWSGHTACSNSGSYTSVCVIGVGTCSWISKNEICSLSFRDNHYGDVYGCFCRGGDPNTNNRGVICVKNDEVTYTVYYSAELTTCNEIYQIGTSVQGQDRERCEERCNESISCQFYFYTTNNWCALYSACEQTRTPAAIGSTFKKISALALTCKVETWGGGLDDHTYQASINNKAILGVTYQVDQFFNGIGAINGVSSSRIIGSRCEVKFMDDMGSVLCTLPPGNYNGGEFYNVCGNDVVTQYIAQSTE